MSAEEKKVAQKIDINGVRNNPEQFFSNQEAVMRLENASHEEQVGFGMSLVAEADESQLENIAEQNQQVLGGFAAPQLRQVMTSAVEARSDFFRMCRADSCSAYLLGKSELEDVTFNPDLHRQIPGLASYIPEEQQVEFLMKAYDDANLGKVARVMSGFGAAISEKFQRLIALNQEQNIAHSDNAAEMIAEKAFNPCLVPEFRQAFLNQINENQEAILANLDVSSLSREEEKRLQQNLQQMNWGGEGSEFLTQMSQKIGELLEAKHLEDYVEVKQKEEVKAAASVARRRNGFLSEPVKPKEDEHNKKHDNDEVDVGCFSRCTLL